jgi:SHS family lactate transporter-like MFS transporter
MVSSASAQIETTAGSNLKTAEGRPDYGKVGAILISVVAAWIILCCLVGRESHGAHFEKGKAAFEEGAGNDEIEESEWSSLVTSTLPFPPSGSRISLYSLEQDH